MGIVPHLHVASSFSLRYGVAPPRALAERAAELGMDLLALTDRDGVYGAVKHVRACRAAGVSPILGADLAFTAGPREPGSTAEGRATALAVGGPGWRSLCRLVTAAHLAGERGAPLADHRMLAERSEGLVVLLGPRSDVGRAVAERRYDDAARLLAAWREHAEVAVEIVDHRGRGDTARAARMLELARRSGVPAVLTNAVRYLDRTDVTAIQVLDAARKLVPLHRRHLEDTTGRAYLASAEELWRIAEGVCGPDRAAVRELIEATRRLGERCAIDPFTDLGMGRAHLPEPVTEDGRAPHAELVARCAAG
ncbi:MAG TPA: PHP domain-containing protein, partial [Thermomonospora sp.]|nr:PHP domain-containing protein [Thermomonospora sp.]